MPAEADKLPTIHIAGNDGVTFKRVPPKSFVQPRKMKTEVFKYSRLRKDSAVHVSLSSSSLVKQPGIAGIPTLPSLEGSRSSHPTTNNNRLLSAVESLIVMRSLRGAKRCVGLGGQCIAALSGRVIGPPDRGCQRPSSRNCRIKSKKFATQRSPYIWGLWPH